MPRRVLVQRDGRTFDLVERAAADEHELQELMKSQPQLIPADDLGIDGDLLVVGRETALASGYIDLLCLSRAGDVVLIEFKTGPQNPDFRHALAQLIDYGSDLWRLSVEDLDRGVVQRFLAGRHAGAEFRAADGLCSLVALTDWHLDADGYAALLGRLAEVLETGDFHFVVAAQRFTAAMQTSLEYLNATMSFGRFYLMEIVQLHGADLIAHAAQVVAAPPLRARPGGGRRAADVASAASLLGSIDVPAAREAMEAILAACATLGLELKWGAQGASVRITTTNRREPLSIGWLLPQGSQWNGATFATFGVDPASLAATGSVQTPVLRFAQRMARIPGARTVESGLNAVTFDWSVLAGAVVPLIAELEELAAEL